MKQKLKTITFFKDQPKGKLLAMIIYTNKAGHDQQSIINESGEVLSSNFKNEVNDRFITLYNSQAIQKPANGVNLPMQIVKDREDMLGTHYRVDMFGTGYLTEAFRLARARFSDAKEEVRSKMKETFTDNT